MHIIKTLGIAFAAIVFSFNSLQAQMPEQSRPTVASIDIEFEGVPNMSDEGVFAHISLCPDQDYDQALVNQSIRSLYNTGNFKLIRVKLTEAQNNKVNVIFVLDPKSKIRSISFEGNEHFVDRKLIKQIESKPGEALDEVLLNRDVHKLRDFYSEYGYSEFDIDFTVIDNAESPTSDVIFKIHEGSKYRISQVKFIGNGPFKQRELRSLLKTKEWGLLSVVTGSGRYQIDVVEDDLQRLREFYREHGFLDVEINESDVCVEHTRGNQMVVTIKICPGRCYHIGNISISGNCLFPLEKFEKLLTVKSGDVFIPSTIEGNADLFRDAYGQVGYLETLVDVQKTPNTDTGAIDLEFIIKESDKFLVKSISLQGNSKTKANVILRELALAPGDVFDVVRMKNSQTRLENTRYFQEVSLSPEATNDPCKKNLSIAIKEGKTGSLSFGVSASSLEKIGGSIELSQSNFDLFNYRNYFQGGGQKFRFKYQHSQRSYQALLSFEEPAIFQRELTLGFSAFRNSNKYDENDYRETKTGFELYFRKRLIELWVGELSYSLEQNELRNIPLNSSAEFKSNEAKRSSSKVGFSLLRDTRNHPYYPTEGLRLEGISEFAGGPFYGQTHYIRLEARAAQWFPICQTLEQVFMVGGRIGAIIPHPGKRVPFTDRYFLGGPDDMRGFAYRNVGPRDPGSLKVTGGDSKVFLTSEYSLKLFDPVRFAVFYDGGLVGRREFDYDFSNDYHHDWGVGLRIFILGAPMRLDYAFPIRGDGFNDKKPNGDKEGGRFQFSFGLVF